jgi:hypothetical protein
MEFRDVKRLLNMRSANRKQTSLWQTDVGSKVHLAQCPVRRAFPAPRLVVHSGRNLDSTLN